jgi:hypothetical protein
LLGQDADQDGWLCQDGFPRHDPRHGLDS